MKKVNNNVHAYADAAWGSEMGDQRSYVGKLYHPNANGPISR